MSSHSKTIPAAELPQADASMLVDRVELERQVQEVYRAVARDPVAPRHFETGRDLAALGPGDRVLDLGSGSGTDSFCAGTSVGETGGS